MMENREEKTRRNAEFAVVAKLLQSYTTKICSIWPAEVRIDEF
jgi:hypothetical protein